MSEAIRVGSIGDVPEGEAIVVPRATAGTVEDIAVIRSDDTFYAIDSMCTHEQEPLVDGWIENGCVECPMHGAMFRLSDGAALSLPAKDPVAVHTIEVIGDDLMLTPNPARLA